MDPNDIETLNQILEQESDLREVSLPPEQITELDKLTRKMVAILTKIHSTPFSEIPALVDSVRPMLQECHKPNAELAKLIPENQFWRWRDLWCNSLRTCVFVASLLEYLSSRTLISHTETGRVLGIKEEWKDRFALSVDDYLHGLITLVNELSRLAVNAVTLENFDEPIKISLFVQDIFAGFTMLNLKNDLLRRRFDSLKYDLKKIEEVVYDVSLRKLASSTKTVPSS